MLSYIPAFVDFDKEQMQCNCYNMQILRFNKNSFFSKWFSKYGVTVIPSRVHFFIVLRHRWTCSHSENTWYIFDGWTI